MSVGFFSLEAHRFLFSTRSSSLQYALLGAVEFPSLSLALTLSLASGSLP